MDSKPEEQLIPENKEKSGDIDTEYYSILKKRIQDKFADLNLEVPVKKNSNIWYTRSSIKPSSIPKKIEQSHEEKKKEIENRALEVDIDLKKSTLNRLFIFLGIETIVVFAFAGLQGFKAKGFYLDEWSFRLLLAATITQITTMLLVAVHHLFPHRK